MRPRGTAALLIILSILCLTPGAQARAMSPKAWRLYQEGLQLRQRGKDAEAITALRNACRADLHADLPHVALAQIYYQVFKNPSLAIEEYEAAITLNPDNPAYRFNLGEMYFITGNYEKADKALSAAIARGSKEAKAHSYLSTIALKEGKLDEADKHIEKALKMNPGELRFTLQKATVLRARKKDSDALQLLDKILKSTSQAGPLYKDSKKLKEEIEGEIGRKKLFSILAVAVPLLVIVTVGLVFSSTIIRRKKEKQVLEQEAAGADTVEGVCQQFLKGVCRLTELTYGIAFLTSPDGNMMKPVAGFVLEPGEFEPLAVSPGDTADWLTVQGGKPFVFNVEKKESAFIQAFPDIRDRMDALEMRVGVPFIYEGRLAGISFMGCQKNKDLMKIKKNYEKHYEDISSMARRAAENIERFLGAEPSAAPEPSAALPGLSVLKEKLTAEVRRCKDRSRNCAVLVVEIDQFQYIDAAYGSSQGDNVIRMALPQIRGVLRDRMDTLSRVEGGVFAILIPDADLMAGRATADHLGARLLEVTFSPEVGNLSASIGVAVYPFHAETPDDLLRNAMDSAAEAKNSGGNRVVVPDKRDVFAAPPAPHMPRQRAEARQEEEPAAQAARPYVPKFPAPAAEAKPPSMTPWMPRARMEEPQEPTGHIPFPKIGAPTMEAPSEPPGRVPLIRPDAEGAPGGRISFPKIEAPIEPEPAAAPKPPARIPFPKMEAPIEPEPAAAPKPPARIPFPKMEAPAEPESAPAPKPPARIPFPKMEAPIEPEPAAAPKPPARIPFPKMEAPPSVEPPGQQPPARITFPKIEAPSLEAVQGPPKQPGKIPFPRADVSPSGLEEIPPPTLDELTAMDVRAPEEPAAVEPLPAKIEPAPAAKRITMPTFDSGSAIPARPLGKIPFPRHAEIAPEQQAPPQPGLGAAPQPLREIETPATPQPGISAVPQHLAPGQPSARQAPAEYAPQAAPDVPVIEDLELGAGPAGSAGPSAIAAPQPAAAPQAPKKSLPPWMKTQEALPIPQQQEAPKGGMPDVAKLRVPPKPAPKLKAGLFHRQTDSAAPEDSTKAAPPRTASSGVHPQPPQRATGSGLYAQQPRPPAPAVQQPTPPPPPAQPVIDESKVDPVTRFFYRSAFEELLAKELMSAKSHGSEILSVVFIRTDNMEDIRSRYDIEKVDGFLREMSFVVANLLREGTDISGTFALGDFAIILPRTNPKIAHNLAEQIRFTIGNFTFSDLDDKITLSLGIASYPENSFEPQELLTKARQAALSAQKDGGNQIIHSDLPPGA
jgi:diguanylate cyclase (GGDEF)-like protein